MIRIYHEDRIFNAGELRPEAFAGAEFERCAFRNGAWMEADLSKARFTDCTFEQCDLSNAVIDGTGYRTVRFAGCKLLGNRFDRCNPFLLRLSFEQCRLDFASFSTLMLKNTRFTGCSLVEVDFAGAGLSNAQFNDCDLSGALFDGTDLTNADLRTAHGFIIDPGTSRIKGAHFALHGLPGLLMQHGIHVEG